MRYLITPQYILGSDSFFVEADTLATALFAARTKIAKEDWSGEWEIYELKEEFTQ